MFCPNCGKQLPDGVRFCTGCGAALTGAAPVPAPEPAPAPAAEPKKKTGLWVAAAAVAVLAVVLAVVFVLAPGSHAPQAQPASQAGDGPEYYEVAEDGTILYKYATEPAPQADAVGDSWDCYTVSINGKAITFPCTLEDFKQSGLVIHAGDSENRQVEARSTISCEYAANDYESGGLTVTFVNGYDEAKPLSQCLVAGVYASVDVLSDDISLTVPGGIQVGRSTRQDVLDAYGQASWESLSDGDGLHPRDFYRWQTEGDTEANDVYVYIDARTDLVEDYCIYRGIVFGGETGT